MLIEVHVVRFSSTRFGFLESSPRFKRLFDSDGNRIYDERMPYTRQRRVGKYRDVDNNTGKLTDIINTYRVSRERRRVRSSSD
jgi:hypothetical protein